jgi:toxin ParE1/3/4
MRRLRVSREAQHDLVEIGQYTLQRWGAAQAELYLRQLDRRMKALVKRPTSGKPAALLREGCWRAREGRHVIFYEFDDETVDVLRVLHERMLPERYL